MFTEHLLYPRCLSKAQTLRGICLLIFLAVWQGKDGYFPFFTKKEKAQIQG